MKKLILISFLWFLIFSIETSSKNTDEKLIKIDSKELGIDANELDIEVIEFERDTNISKVKVILKEGTSVGSSIFITFAYCQLAKYRNYKYFVTLKENEDNYEIDILGLTNKKDVDIKKEFGNQYFYAVENEMKLLSVDGKLCSFALSRFGSKKRK